MMGQRVHLDDLRFVQGRNCWLPPPRSSEQVKVIHGANDDFFSVVGESVGRIRASLKDAFNLPDEAAPFRDGIPVPNSYRLRAHEVLEFVVPWGRKGGDDPPLSSPMTVKEAAALLGCSISFVYKLMRNGEIAYERRGRRKLPIRDSVDEYRKRNVVQALTKPVMLTRTGARRYRHLFN